MSEARARGCVRSSRPAHKPAQVLDVRACGDGLHQYTSHDLLRWEPKERGQHGEAIYGIWMGVLRTASVRAILIALCRALAQHLAYIGRASCFASYFSLAVYSGTRNRQRRSGTCIGKVRLVLYCRVRGTEALIQVPIHQARGRMPHQYHSHTLWIHITMLCWPMR